MSEVALPGPDSRTAVIGSTGTGKTQFAVWLLSTRDYLVRPWIIFNFKGDRLLNELGATVISLNHVPKGPGLYIVNPLPGDEILVSNFFAKAWQQEYVGLYIDEGYMIPKNDRWFRACLTQGRSKLIEMIICSQRPVFLDKFVFTESNFFSVFNINYKEDRKHLAAYLDDRRPEILPRYHSLWYDVTEQRSNIFKPVPEKDVLLNRFVKDLENKPVKI